MDWFSSVLAAFGVLCLAITWWGLRVGARWAWWALAAAAVLTLVAFPLVLRPYLRAGAPDGLGDLPPLCIYPAFVAPVALVLGWIGLREIDNP